MRCAMRDPNKAQLFINHPSPAIAFYFRLPGKLTYD